MAAQSVPGTSAAPGTSGSAAPDTSAAPDASGGPGTAAKPGVPAARDSSEAWSDRAPDTHAERGLELAQLILGRAAEAGLRPGSRLPTERQLAQDLGVTRSSVRYALGIMAAQGHISREVGRGTYLRAIRQVPSAGDPGLTGPPGGASYPLPGSGPVSFQPAEGSGGAQLPRGAQLDGAQLRGPQPRGAQTLGAQPDSAQSAFAPADVMMVRRLLEPPAMPLAVAWATAGDFQEMDRCLAGGDRSASYEEFEAWDMALHRSIMAATHSPLLVTLYGSIEAARHGHIWGDLKRRSASVERRRLYQADHHDIVAALKARDSGGAVKAMRAHLARVSDHLDATDPAASIWP
jgi:DNA-binding FadR family transcriptional regulator